MFHTAVSHIGHPGNEVRPRTLTLVVTVLASPGVTTFSKCEKYCTLSIENQMGD